MPFDSTIEDQIQYYEQYGRFSLDKCGRKFNNDDVIAVAKALQQSTHIKTLDLDASCITTAEACSAWEGFLASSPSLSKILLKGDSAQVIDVIDQLLSAAKNNPVIEEMRLWDSKCSIRALSSFFLSSSLKVMVLENVSVEQSIESPEDFLTFASALRQCGSIEEVSLTGRPREFVAAILQEGLCGHPSLQRLNLDLFGYRWRESRPHITIMIAEALGNFLHSIPPHFKTIELCGWDFSFDTMQPIILGFLHNRIIDSIIFNWCSFGTEDRNDVVPAIALLATRIRDLQTLEFDICNLNDEIVQALFPSTLAPPSTIETRTNNKHKLHRLCLNKNNISNQGIRTLVAYLKQPESQVHYLGLKQNPIGNEGAILLADVLQTCGSLTELDLDWCNIGRTGVHALLEALPHNSTLKVLGLENLKCGRYEDLSDDHMFENCLSNPDMFATLSKVLPLCRLKVLKISANFFDWNEDEKGICDKCQEEVLQGLASNRTLTKMRVTENILNVKRKWQLSYFTWRNKFQPLVEAQFLNDGTSASVEHGFFDGHSDGWIAVPYSLWASTLAVAQKQHFYGSSVVFDLLSSQPGLIGKG